MQPVQGKWSLETNRIYVELWPVTSIPGTEKMDARDANHAKLPRIFTRSPRNTVPDMTRPKTSKALQSGRWYCFTWRGIHWQKWHALWICITGIEVISYHFNLFFNNLFGDEFFKVHIIIAGWFLLIIKVYISEIPPELVCHFQCSQFVPLRKWHEAKLTNLVMMSWNLKVFLEDFCKQNLQSLVPSVSKYIKK